MDFIKIVAQIKDNQDVALARLLILLQVFEGRKPKAFRGLTKLAKLDFLLRYPVYLEKALEKQGVDSAGVEIAPIERDTIESKMIRYKYGPWDPKHRGVVNLMVARNLATAKEKDAPTIKLTNAGIDAAKHLMVLPEFSDMAIRAKLLYRNFNESGKWLKDFIYDAFPEIITLRLGEEIDYE